MVYGENGQRLHGKTFKTDGMLKVTYDAKNLSSGLLTFNVVCNNQLACSELVTVANDGTLTIPKPICAATESVPENIMSESNFSAFLKLPVGYNSGFAGAVSILLY